jgi:EmrB/QacA subfamily drug resistance transporter
MLKRVEYKWIVAVIFVLGLFMEIMDMTILNVAIPTIRDEFDASHVAMEWTVLGYLLSLAIFIPASGWVGDKFGTKKTFLFALFVFTLASALCGLSQSVEQLIVFRILQGVGGGMLTPVGTAMLYRAFPPEERARASTVLIIPTVIAPATGPIIGGLLIDWLSWHWIFYVNLPIGILGFIFGWKYLKEHTEPTAGDFDKAGFFFSGLGLAGVLYSLSKAPEEGWLSPWVVFTGFAGLALLVMAVYVETHRPNPMLALRLYRDRMFRNANMVNTLAYGSFAAFLFLLPQFMQELLGYSALESGLTTFPQAIGIIVTSQFVGKLYHTVGPRRLITGGLVAVTVSNIPFILLDLDANAWQIRGLMLARGISMAFAFVPLQAATYANIEKSDTGRASAIFSTQRQVSAALGVAILATLFLTRLHALQGDALPTPDMKLEAFRWAFIGSSVITAAGAIFAFANIRDIDAAATMRRPFTAVESLELEGEIEGDIAPIETSPVVGTGSNSPNRRL